jgi:hypothetical protein
VWRNFEKISRVVAGWHPLWSKAAPASATRMRRGLKILKLLRVPRGSVRGKCGRRKGADGASPSKIVMGLGERSRLGCAQGAAVTEIKNDPVGFAE